jgi:uroporphyrinogen decarboxylase
MTAKERVLAALRHEEPDKVPYQVGFTGRMHERMAEFYGDPRFAEGLGNCLLRLSCSPAGAWREVAPDIWEDDFAVRWDRSVDRDIGVVCNRMVTPETLGDYEMPDPDEPSRYARFDELIEACPDLFAVADLGFSLFERAWTLAGMETVLMAMVADKAFVNELLDRILAFNLRVIENACRHDVHAMMFGDDWGQQSGLIMGPHLWGEFIRPRVERMYGEVKQRGKFVFIHSCGKVDELFPELIECGLDVFNPFQPEVMDVFEVKRRYGDRLSFYGGISTQRTLPYGTVEQVRSEVERLLEEVGRGGGYMAAPSHAIPPDARPENVAAMIEVLQGQ